jgi:hypothetical protein
VGFRLRARRSVIPRVIEAFSHNKLVVAFISMHLLLAIFLGRLFALAPDEGGYLYTFNNIYGSKDPNPQFNSGWIVAPKPFLWTTYLPAKILDILGFPDYLAVRMLSIAIVTLSLVLLLHQFFSGLPSAFAKSLFWPNFLSFLSALIISFKTALEEHSFIFHSAPTRCSRRKTIFGYV